MATGSRNDPVLPPTDVSCRIAALTPRWQGVLLVLLSAAVFSCAGLFVKGVAADSWTILFWRGLSASAFMLLYLRWRGALRTQILDMGKPGIFAAIVGALATAAFVPAFKFTSIANVSLIYAAVPFVAAVIAALWMREKPAASVVLASSAAFLGVLVIVGGSLHSVNLQGDLLALWMTVGMALFLCIYRRYPKTPAAGPTILSALMWMIPAIWLSEPLAISARDFLLTCGFGLVFALAAVTMAEGARRLPAAETALISALETPLAPLWAYLVFAEIPGRLALIGGAIILGAVFASQIYALRCEKVGEPGARSRKTAA